MTANKLERCFISLIKCNGCGADTMHVLVSLCISEVAHCSPVGLARLDPDVFWQTREWRGVQTSLPRKPSYRIFPVVYTALRVLSPVNILNVHIIYTISCLMKSGL